IIYIRILVSIFINNTTTTEIYTLSLHDALPISKPINLLHSSDKLKSPNGIWAKIIYNRFPDYFPFRVGWKYLRALLRSAFHRWRSEEHTSELQSRENLVCRLLLEERKKECE